MSIPNTSINPTPYECMRCGERFATKYKYEYHHANRNIKCRPKRDLECSNCMRRFARKYLYQSHISKPCFTETQKIAANITQMFDALSQMQEVHAKELQELRVINRRLETKIDEISRHLTAYSYSEE